MIRVENVTKRYGPKTAVRNISFEIERGEIVGFLGPNGAGKTTTMRVLTGFLPPSEGRAVVAGFDVGTHPIDVKRRTGYLPESPPLYPELGVNEYLRFVALIKGIPRREVERRVSAAVERTACGDVLNTLIGKLSKGYRQRVGLAQALIHNPEVLVLDEPTSGLDPKQIIEVRSLIRSLAGEHTIILSTHILPEVSDTCSRVIIINEGRIEASDTPENLRAGLEQAQSVLLEVDGPERDVQERLRTEAGVLGATRDDEHNGRIVWRVEVSRDPAILRRLAEAVVNSGWGLYGMRSVGLSLEEIFLKLTSDEEQAVADADDDMPQASEDASQDSDESESSAKSEEGEGA